MKKIFRLILRFRKPAGILLILVFGYLVLVVGAVRAAFEFRKGPSLKGLEYFMSSEMPHVVIGRVIVFWKGSSSYQSTLREWVYSRGQVKDYFWNRIILKNDLENMAKEDRAEYLRRYPMRVSDDMVPFILEGISFARSRYELIPMLELLEEAEADKKNYTRWVNMIVKDPHSEVVLDDALEHIVSSDSYLWSDVAWRRWMDEDRRGSVVRSLENGLVWSSESRKFFERFRSELVSNGKPLGEYEVRIVRTFLAMPEAYLSALGIVEREFSRLGGQEIMMLLEVYGEEGKKLALRIFELSVQQKPDFVVSAFRELAWKDVVAAEREASAVIAEGDSGLRKDMIVILTSVGSAEGVRNIDMAFRGRSLREEMFSSRDHYVYGSEASAEYQRIVGHGYLETGKLWPPAKGIKKDTVIREGEAYKRLWRDFIDEYPWFPGTDDAYYHLSYEQYVSGDTKGAVSTIEEYFGLENLPDKDSDPFLRRLLWEIVCDGHWGLVEGGEYFKNVLDNSPPELIFENSETRRLKDLHLGLLWFENTPGKKRLLGLDGKRFRSLMSVVVKMQWSDIRSFTHENAGKKSEPLSPGVEDVMKKVFGEDRVGGDRPKIITPMAGITDRLGVVVESRNEIRMDDLYYKFMMFGDGGGTCLEKRLGEIEVKSAFALKQALLVGVEGMAGGGSLGKEVSWALSHIGFGMRYGGAHMREMLETASGVARKWLPSQFESEYEKEYVMLNRFLKKRRKDD